MGFHNYHAYLSTWSYLSKSGNGTKDLQSRPNAFAIMDDNTTITSAWTEQNFNNMSKLYDDYGFVVINVSMAMPHVGVASAAIDPINKIMQPAACSLQILMVKASIVCMPRFLLLLYMCCAPCFRRRMWNRTS